LQGKQAATITPAMFNTYLVAEKTAVTTKGNGPAIEIAGAQHRVFLVQLIITNVVEQEAMDLSVFGAASGEDAAWGKDPLVRFPQVFYRGEYPLLLDLSAQPEVKFVRAQWEVNRWGRGSETPSFEFAVKIAEVSPELLAEARPTR
jgi:hypothetical protein